MNATPSRLLAVVVCIIGLFAFCPAQARADGISIGFLAVASMGILIPLIAFEVVVEAVLLAKCMRINYRQAMWVAFVANVASILAGIPVKILNAFIYEQLLPRPMAAYFRAYPWAVLLGTTIYFIVTLLTEYAAIAAWRRKHAIAVSAGRLAAYVLAANVLTYAVLAPIHYIATRPTNEIREFTDDTRWAHRPPSSLFYICGNGQLCSALTDGQDQRVVIPDQVRDYQYLPEQGAFLYRNGKDQLCLFREAERKTRVCWDTEQRFMMDQVACSPNARTVAYLAEDGKVGRYQLVLHDVDSDKSVKTDIMTAKDVYEPQVAWSNTSSTLFIRENCDVRTILVNGNLTATRAAQTVSTGSLPVLYGRFRTGPRWTSESGGMDARTMPGLDSRLTVTVNDISFTLADNPGLLKFGQRYFSDVSFLENGKELVFDDGHDIYLMDVHQRKVGRIVEGAKIMLQNADFRHNIFRQD